MKVLNILAFLAAFAMPVAALAGNDGEIRKVDKEAGKLTIKHGELKDIGMGPMTMVFKVKSPDMLEKVKAGDKVSFSVEHVGGALTVTAIDLVK
jgi:Cu(I)/Ag(I) efflux system protein CusF